MTTQHAECKFELLCKSQLLIIKQYPVMMSITALFIIGHEHVVPFCSVTSLLINKIQNTISSLLIYKILRNKDGYIDS